MYNKNALPLASLSAALFSALYTSSAISAAPDPGNIQREQQRLESPKREPNTAEHPLQINENEATKPLDNGTRLTVKQFRINGNTAFGEEELIRLLAPYLGHELTFPKLQEAIDRISMHYRQQGYFVARAFLPAQTIQDGIVSIIVSEGRLGQVNVYVDGRAKPETITDIIHHQLAENDLLKLDKVERAILLVGDLAGFNTRATLEPGVGSGLSDLRVDVKEGPLFTGSVDADNFGSRYTGEARAGFTGNINSPTGRGDQATIRLNHTSHMNYGRLAYTTPLGNDGLKVGASLYDMRYDLCCNNTFTRLDYRGSAQGWGLNALYPIKRSQNRNLSAVIGYEAKDIQGRSDLGKTSDRDSRAVRFELNGDHADNYFGGGLNNYGISYTIGNMDINLAAERMNDRFAARTDGGWNKTNLSAVRLQHVTDRLTLYVAFNGQYAPHNLDTSEKFSLGGVYGVRAYSITPAGLNSGNYNISYVDGTLNILQRPVMTPVINHFVQLAASSVSMATVGVSSCDIGQFASGGHDESYQFTAIQNRVWFDVEGFSWYRPFHGNRMNILEAKLKQGDQEDQSLSNKNQQRSGCYLLGMI